MNTQDSDWPRALAWFERAADATPAERRRLLDELGSDDPALRAHVQRLLALDASDSDLGADVVGWRERLIEAAGEETVPARIGAWRIVRELGQGGMGRVFLAERADGEYEQQVALKLIRGEFTSDTAVARFLAERRILARLDHPSIASLVDGGVDADGRPWFAMQYVEGIALPDHCTRHALGLEARLKLVVAVCEAVAYAHRQLVVHCDLKPSNVLVDNHGQPRLLDFGIARLLEPRGGERQITQTQARALTPGYAAPEQLAGEPVSVATDVYALGAMLYELLTGVRPYAGSDATPVAVAVAQAKGEPRAPSRIDRPDAPVAARKLRGDLDLIVGTALRHDSARRYPGADALADDLRRRLTDRPLHAHRDSITYRLRKFLLRHRMAVPLVVLALTGLIAATVFALHQTGVAWRQAAEANAVRDFLVGMFRSADPRAGKGSIDTRALIDRSRHELDRALQAQPELATGFAEVLGHVYRDLAAYDDAATMFGRALTLTERRYGSQAPQLAPILRGLAATDAERGNLDAASKEAERARVLDTRAYGDSSAEVGADLAQLADLAQRRGDLPGSQELLAQALQRTHAAKSPDAARVATLLNQRANLEAERGMLDDAEHDTRDALSLFRTRSGDDSLDVAENLINLGVLRMRRGDAAGAEPQFRQGIAVYRRLLPAEHPLVADALTDLARSLDRQGKADQAQPIYLDVLTMQRHLFGDVHPDVATTLNNLAVLYASKGDYAKARTAMQQVVDIWARTAGLTHPQAMASRGNLGVIEREQGDYKAAWSTLEAALNDYRAQPDSTARQAYCLDQLGITARYRGQLQRALELHRQADALRIGLQQLNPIEKAAGLIAYSLAESAANSGFSAKQHADAAIATLEQAHATADARYAEALLARARAALLLSDTRSASANAGKALALRQHLYGSEDWRTAEAQLVAAEVDRSEHRWSDAVAKTRAARAVLVAKRGPGNPLVHEADRVLQGSDRPSPLTPRRGRRDRLQQRGRDVR